MHLLGMPRHPLHAMGADLVIGYNRKRQKKLIKAAKANKTLPVKGGDLPVGGDYPLTCLGVTSEAFGDALGDYVRSNPDSSLKREPLLQLINDNNYCWPGTYCVCLNPSSVSQHAVTLDTNCTQARQQGECHRRI